jgi:Mannosyl-glycoprotein endo-beta-N-acetylglucosaminidase
VKRNQPCNEPAHRIAGPEISRRQLLKLLGGTCAYGVLASILGRGAWAQASTDLAAPPASIQGPAIATQEQAWRWLSANDAHEQTYGWISLAWAWGESVGIRPDLMLAQQMFETGWGYFGGMVTPEHHNVAGIKVGDVKVGDLPEDFERFASWSEGIRAHANHLAAYSGAVPVLGPSGEPLHDRYYVVMGLPWTGSVQTINGLSGKWSTRGDYAQVLLERFLVPLRNS